MANKKITILPGDGIGLEITQWGKRVLENIAEHFGHNFEFESALIGHSAIEATGNPLPDELSQAANDETVEFLGAVF